MARGAQSPPGVLEGTVTDSAGHPVPGAVLIGTNDLAVTTADADGHWSMRCPDEPLLASAWVVPLDSGGPHPNGVGYGKDTTAYGPIPSAEPLAYTFTGGSTLATATTPRCTTAPLHIVLPAAATVRVTFTGGPYSTGPGSTTTAGGGDPASDSSPPLDNLYLPALGDQAGLGLAPVDDSGLQVLSGLAGGTLRIDGVSSDFSCSGPGVTPGPASAVETVAVGAGQTVAITCAIVPIS